MSTDEFIHNTVENFLIEQHNNLTQDRQALSALLKQILQEQQIASCSDDNIEVNRSNPNVNEIQSDNSAGDETRNKVEQVSRHPEHLSNPKLREYNWQVEKEKLINSFENSQFPFVSKSTLCRYPRNSKQLFSSSDKENVISDQVSNDKLAKGATRFGEYSPLNPTFKCNDRILGLGEYEELRKIFLLQKKKEYVNYMNDVIKNTEMRYPKDKLKPLEKEINVDKLKKPFVESSSSSVPSFRDLSCSDRKLVLGMKKHQQEIYRQQLDKQIEEKKRLQLAEVERERRLCEIWQNKNNVRNDNTAENIENKFDENMCCNNLKELNREASNVAPKKKEFVRCCSANNFHENPSKSVFKKNLSISLPLQNPILKPMAETCKIDDYELYQKMQQELYKQDLVQQIREKKMIERNRKLKELEMEKKIEENARKAEEKLREQFEKEQAERHCRATQKAQFEKQLFENLNRIQKQEDENKKTKKLLQSKMGGIYPTNHKVDEKPKNVKFLPDPLVYPICGECSFECKCNSPVNISMKKSCESGSMIVQAPYVLAVKDIECNSSLPRAKLEKTFRPPSPILPAVKTRNLIDSLSKCDHLEIPPGVSMSEQTKSKFIRDDRILSNLSEIRRKLLENQSKHRNNGIS